jgi:hypothetical protein
MQADHEWRYFDVPVHAGSPEGSAHERGVHAQTVVLIGTDHDAGSFVAIEAAVATEGRFDDHGAVGLAADDEIRGRGEAQQKLEYRQPRRGGRSGQASVHDASLFTSSR